MEWVNDLNAAMDYLEAHLEEETDCAALAGIAGCSAYHFQRMFSYIAGMPLTEYVRRRRMTRAADELLAGARVLDTALRYGYDSPTAFTRAFRAVHGVSPSQAQAGATLRAFLPIRFSFSLQGGTVLNYRIEEKPPLRVLGIFAPLDPELETNFQEVPMLWARAAAEGLPGRLAPLMRPDLPGILGVSACMPGGQWRYYIAAASDAPAPPDLESYTISAQTWAVFSGSGPMPLAIQELEKRAVLEWLPSSGYEYADAPDVELYLSPDPQNAVFQVWLPVVKKA